MKQALPHRPERAAPHPAAFAAAAAAPAKNGGEGKPARKPPAGWQARQLALEAELAALRREHAELGQALAEAAQVHRRLCAPRELRRGRMEISSEVFPVRHIAGDFSGAFDLGRALGLTVGDVAGKGLTAGLWVTHLAGLARLHAAAHDDPAAALAAINRHLCGLRPEAPLAGLLLARLDTARGHLVYSNAGLPAPLVLRGDGDTQPLTAGGPLLGAVAEANFTSGRAALGPGDTLLMFSDGITECRNAREEEFDSRRLLAAARTAPHTSAVAMLFSILGAVQDFAGNRPRTDDFTLLVARHAGKSTR